MGSAGLLTLRPKPRAQPGEEVLDVPRFGSAKGRLERCSSVSISAIASGMMGAGSLEKLEVRDEDGGIRELLDWIGWSVACLRYLTN